MLAKKLLFLFAIVVLAAADIHAQPKKFRVLALYENGGHHIEFSKRAKVLLDKLAIQKGFTIDYIQKTDKIDDAFFKSLPAVSTIRLCALCLDE